MSEWISVETDGLPGNELLNSGGKKKFLCVVNWTGAAIVARGIDAFMFTKTDGFLVGYKGPLKGSITHWQELPLLPPIPDKDK